MGCLVVLATVGRWVVTMGTVISFGFSVVRCISVVATIFTVVSGPIFVVLGLTKGVVSGSSGVVF